MNSGRRSGVRLSVGGSSILVIFVILTLTTFATLSLVSANADYNLSRKSMSAAVEYYRADAQAEEILSRIDARLAGIPGGSGFEDEAEAALKEMTEVSTERDGSGALLARYTVTVNPVQELVVVLALGDGYGPERYMRREWKVISTVSDEKEEGLNLWIDEGAADFLDEEDLLIVDDADE